MLELGKQLCMIALLIILLEMCLLAPFRQILYAHCCFYRDLLLGLLFAFPFFFKTFREFEQWNKTGKLSSCKCGTRKVVLVFAQSRQVFIGEHMLLCWFMMFPAWNPFTVSNIGSTKLISRLFSVCTL